MNQNIQHNPPTLIPVTFHLKWVANEEIKGVRNKVDLSPLNSGSQVNSKLLLTIIVLMDCDLYVYWGEVVQTRKRNVDHNNYL